MARVIRIALDVALFSLGTVKPVVSKAWTMTKSAVQSTKAKTILFNPVVAKVETSLDTLTEILAVKLKGYRNSLLPKEEKFLLKELEKVRKQIKDGSDKPWTTTTALKPRLSIAWQYAKVEIAPPMTVGFLHGPIGQKLENAVSNGVDRFIGGLKGKIDAIEAEEARKKKEEENAIKAAQDKIKAEAKAKEETKKKEIADKLAKDAKEAKEKAIAKTKAEAKAETKPETEAKPKAEKKEPAKKEEPKPKKK